MSRLGWFVLFQIAAFAPPWLFLLFVGFSWQFILLAFLWVNWIGMREGLYLGKMRYGSK